MPLPVAEYGITLYGAGMYGGVVTDVSVVLLSDSRASPVTITDARMYTCALSDADTCTVTLSDALGD